MTDFTDIIDRNRDHIREICRRHGVRGDAVGDLLVQAGYEVLLRQRITLDEEGRFLRSFERHCREHARRCRGSAWRRLLDLFGGEDVPEEEGAGREARGEADAPGEADGSAGDGTSGRANGAEPVDRRGDEDDPEKDRRGGGEGER